MKKRIKLRPVEMNDLEVLHKWKNNKEVYRFLGGGYSPISKVEYEKWVQSMCGFSEKDKRFIIEIDEIEQVGMVGVYSINYINRVAEIGIFIGEVTARNNGVGQYSYDMIEEYATSNLNLRKLKVFVVKSNEKAVNFWLKQNYQILGTMKQERYIDGLYHDVLYMEKFIKR